jgi:hypothetical protein
VSKIPDLHRDTALSLRGGALVVATAAFEQSVSVAGDTHTVRLMSSTSYDTTMATLLAAHFTRVVCNNTFVGALLGAAHVIKLTHAKEYNVEVAQRTMATVLQSIKEYKALGDAMASVTFTKEQLTMVFKTAIGIDLNEKKEDVSTRKMNAYRALWEDYSKTTQETEAGTAWAAWNAVTRFVDHTRDTKQGEANANLSRFASATFGTGKTTKATVWNMLAPMVADKVKVAA